MSLTEALRAGAPGAFGALYDEHAEQLYAYCHIMIGDEAADAVRDAFIAVARHPGTAPDDDALPVWLYALARAECVRRGALVRKPAMAPSADPLRRALARLRPEHREALALSTALEADEIARVIGVAADTAEMLVRVSQRRLEQAAASVLGARTVHDEAMLAALSGGNLHKLVMRGYEAPPRQRERVLFSCAAAERAADGALLFDQDGMPIPLDGLFGTAEEPTHPFTQVADASDEPTGPMPHADSEQESPLPSAFTPRRTSRGGGVHVVHARSKKTPLLGRKRDGLVEVAGLAACVAAATSVLALWPGPHNNGASNMDGSSLFLHREAPASRSAQPTPSMSNGTPPQGATSKPGASPSPTPAKAASATTAPPTTTTSDQPAPPPADGSNPSHPTSPPNDPPPSDPPPSDPPTSEPPTTTPTPTPSDSPTDSDSDSPSPDSSAP